MPLADTAKGLRRQQPAPTSPCTAAGGSEPEGRGARTSEPARRRRRWTGRREREKKETHMNIENAENQSGKIPRTVASCELMSYSSASTSHHEMWFLASSPT